MIKKFFAGIIVLMLLASFTNVVYAVGPDANASVKKIKEWISKNESKLSDVPISKMVTWNEKLKKVTDKDSDAVYTVQKIETNLGGRKASQIKKYMENNNLDTVEEFKNSPLVNTGISRAWATTLSNASSSSSEKSGDSESSNSEYSNFSKVITDANTEYYDEKLKEQEKNMDEAERKKHTVQSPLGESSVNYNAATGNDSTLIGNKVGPILGIIRNVGIVLAVIFLMIIGVKYMLGSVEERGEYKKTLLPYLIGTIILFIGSIIPQLIYEVMK